MWKHVLCLFFTLYFGSGFVCVVVLYIFQLFQMSLNIKHLGKFIERGGYLNFNASTIDRSIGRSIGWKEGIKKAMND